MKPMPMSLANQRITVMGLGRFGGGEGLVQWLLSEGAHVLVADLADEATLQPALDRIESATGGRPTVHTGPHDTRDFTDTDLVIVNPAVPQPWSNTFLEAARGSGVSCTTAMRLLLERLPQRRRIIGVTGTVGKSTTASMLHHVLGAAGLDARLGGNIGGSLLPELHTITPETWVVLEISSAQLHWLDEGHDDWPGWSPHIALTTNIAANHLDWHGDETAYRAAKAVIRQFQREGDVSIDSASCNDAGTIELRLPGTHNQANARLALAGAVTATGKPFDDLAVTLRTFGGLEHRLQPVDGLGSDRSPRIWNDAKSSAPEATMLALNSFGDRLNRIHLIVGGYDKGVSLDTISKIAPSLAGLYCIGATGPELARMAREEGACAFDCGTLNVAVDQAMDKLGDDGVLLLSPACASWDQFTDFRARGEQFLKLIGAHLAAC